MKFIYPVKSFDIYDADTVRTVLDRGFGETKKLSVRVMGIDAPEIRTRNKLEKQAGKLVTSVAAQWLSTVETLIFHSVKRDKYAGRGVGHLHDYDAPDDTLSKYLIGLNVVEAYDGGTKQAWTDKRLKEIIRICNEQF